ncbi:uncharacterized protein PADG_03769 [Paracoccidioides brasiliensis Pb18]|uniref:Uncharacterized protein n=1 Tax=Paracoccidioides brasiliensis (strain Pb18) TaxID=502780 RepID=C1G933_PARBD|nr:uncharacterized protein PADG_03769 [Paracoccidioides brasiliensis Pb18]EEH47685.2 hypothetical protein PADG_03769 [Paracoccidioides brasiliensis Pb18]
MLQNQRTKLGRRRIADGEEAVAEAEAAGGAEGEDGGEGSDLTISQYGSLSKGLERGHVLYCNEFPILSGRLNQRQLSPLKNPMM